MCGFVGSFNGSLKLSKEMADLSHRGPDSSGVYQDEKLFLKHFRLSILGDKKFAAQPMESRDKTVLIAFNGEIYNYKEIADAMGNGRLADEGDTRVLVEFFSRHGLEKINQLNGMFAIAVYFRKTGAFHLVRDRFGVKPLYYIKDKGGVYFASEIKSLRRAFDLPMDDRAVSHYLDAGRYPSGKASFYRGVTQVEVGTEILFGSQSDTISRYFDLRSACRILIEKKISLEEYENSLADSIKLRLRSDVPISLHFSGGTDSTALLLKTQEVWGQDYPLTAFTAGYDEEDFDESSYARDYCQRLGVEHHKVTLKCEEVPKLAEELAWFEDEPYGGIPTLAYYKMNKVERAMGSIVSIEGQGGDEALGGYLTHLYMAVYDLHRSGAEPALLQKILKENSLDLEKTIQTAEKFIQNGFKAHTDLTDFCEDRGDHPDFFVDWLRTVQVYDILENKIPRVLRFNDRASMACGREVRFPLLDYRVLLQGLSFGHEVKFADGLGKTPLRWIIKRHLKEEVYQAPKRLVVTPQTQWLRGPLKEWAFSRAQLLREKNTLEASYFDRFNDFFKKPEPENSFYVWQIINLSFLWDRQAVDKA